MRNKDSTDAHREELGEQYAKERRRWAEVVQRLNQQASSVQYELVRCAVDGYWYIAPQPEPTEMSVEDADVAPPFTNVVIPPMGNRRWLRNGENILDMTLEIDGVPQQDSYVGRFSYQPFTGEFLPDVLASHHHETIHQYGSHSFNEYQRGIYVRPRRTLLLRPYWNPVDEHGRFDPYQAFDYEVSSLVTNTTV
ncbi:hypothetical protein D6789_03940, partial [Candidatus Woesearchaeota archaeon]